MPPADFFSMVILMIAICQPISTRVKDDVSKLAKGLHVCNFLYEKEGENY